MSGIAERQAQLRAWVEAEVERQQPIHIAHHDGRYDGGGSDGIGDLGGPGQGPQTAPPEATPDSPADLTEFWNELSWGPTFGDAEALDFDGSARPGFCGEAQGASNSGAAAGFGASRWGSSLNWSGAVLHARNGQRFRAAAARWVVPGATRPVENVLEGRPVPDMPLRMAALAEGKPLPDSWRCSVWVGLDGHRLSSLSLPQIGTTTIVEAKDGVPRTRTHAWAQWWVRGKMYGEQRFQHSPDKPFEVNAGDRVTAFLVMLSRSEVLLRIRNERTKRIGSAIWSSGEVGPEGNIGPVQQIHRQPAPAEGAAAVFVVERPTVMFGDELYPLPDFGEVVFERCVAGLRGPSDKNRTRLVDLTGARLIRMVRQRPDPFRTSQGAVPKVLTSRHGFSVRYRA